MKKISFFLIVGLISTNSIALGSSSLEDVKLKAKKGDAKAQNILINVVDKPDLCDFYSGSIITKGNIKIAISTDGKSPILSKRLRQFFDDFLPNDLAELSQNLNQYRQSLKSDFEKKVSDLNRLTKKLIVNNKL